MNYRAFPKIPECSISTLGLGCMRLPVLDNNDGRIDKKAFEKMIYKAHELGINYADTAYVYHQGQSEVALGEVLASTSLRDKFYLATKAPTWQIASESDWSRILDEQLKRLKTDHIDFYLLHALSRSNWDKVLKYGGLEALHKAKEQGKILHAGFSFHDSYDVFKEIIDNFNECEFCQLQYNYLDIEYQAGTKGMEYAASKNIGAIVMGPLRGGSLASPPPEVKQVLDSMEASASPAGHAMRFVLSRAAVVTALSGMGTIKEIIDNAQCADSAHVASVTAVDAGLFNAARDLYKKAEKVNCTTCGYCQPCPYGILIPEVFSLYNSAAMLGTHKSSSDWYVSSHVKSGTGGDSCTTCRECEPKCPQFIAIPEKLVEAHQYLTSGN